jgi:nucleoside 2-deoxyribosyltransferase
MRKIRIYIAGAVRETSYREFVHKVYGDNQNLELLDPIRIVTQCFPEVVELDKQLIKDSDIVVAYIHSPSWGTSMEMIYAYENGIPVYVINPNKDHMENFWVKYHTTKFFDNISDCFDEILQENMKEHTPSYSRATTSFESSSNPVGTAWSPDRTLEPEVDGKTLDSSEP